MNTSIRTPFRFPDTTQIAMPLGGLGAGCISLNGIGGLVDFSLRHQPGTSALPDDHGFRDAAFALLHIKGERPVTRLVEGPLEPGKIYDQKLQGQGYRRGGHDGLPRFARSEFSAGYPFGRVELRDPKIPLKVEVLGFNPFIPLDARNSGIPCALLEDTFRNISKKTVSFEFSFHLSHLALGVDEGWQGTRTRALEKRGVYFFNTDGASSPGFGSACLLSAAGGARVKGMWFRGGWFDGISQLWREVSTGTFRENDGHNGVDMEGRNGGSILFARRLAPRARITLPIIVAWYFPNANITSGLPAGHPVKSPAWQPYYSGVWKDALDVAEYASAHYASLRSRTASFQESLLSTSCPPEVIDAVSSNLPVLKSPTVLRQKNGNVWGWEGCFTTEGCCPGSCTHVWNYAQAMPHLFPDLERTLREQELQRSLDERGHANFRSALPDGPVSHDFHAAADGQLGGILKLHREWQISGDLGWMKKLYSLARRSLLYCVETWDPERRGALFEPHHNTYDIEFWGPDGMCTSIYLGALKAMASMADAVGQEMDRQTFEGLAERGAAFMDKELFNGEYYEQLVQSENLRDSSFRERVAGLVARGSREGELLATEGPKYQYGQGCLSDGIIGEWMAWISGVETGLDRRKVRGTLLSIFRNNFLDDLSEHANCQRPGYALGKEAGLVLCSWPKGGKPTLPFVYSDEVWTGIEYQVATHLISEGFVREGLRIVKATRSRHRGDVRNPFDEYECGSFYARAMASFALLQAFSGFRYSAVEKTLWFGPKIRRRPYRTFFCTATGWGAISLARDSITISLEEGFLELRQIQLAVGRQIRTIQVNKIAKSGRLVRIPLAKSSRS